MYLDHLSKIAEADVAGLKKAQESYGDSWKQRGGIGAFMMLARKWDRLEKRVGQAPQQEARENTMTGAVISGSQSVGNPYDIFQHIEADDRSEGIIDDLRDLRRYLMLVEAEMIDRGAKSTMTTHRDNEGEPERSPLGRHFRKP